MFVFGSHIFGKTGFPGMSSSSVVNDEDGMGGPATSSSSPSHQHGATFPQQDDSFALQKHMDRERALLDELEQTRAQIRTQEQRVLADESSATTLAMHSLQPGGDDNNMSSYAASQSTVPGSPLRQNFLENTGSTVVGGGGRHHPPAHPQESAVNLLPILTNTGELPFERGLHDEGAPHMLPLFKLPEVTSNSKIVNRIPPPESLQSIRKRQRDTRDKAEVQRVLGLSDGEMASLATGGLAGPNGGGGGGGGGGAASMVLMKKRRGGGGGRRHRRGDGDERSREFGEGEEYYDGSRDAADGAPEYGATTALPRLDMSALGSASNSNSRPRAQSAEGGPRKQHVRGAGGGGGTKRRTRTRRPAGAAEEGHTSGGATYQDEFLSRATPRCLRTGASGVTADKLRTALKTSIGVVQKLTVRVRDNITEVQRLYPGVNVRAQLYLQKWGLEKFEQICGAMEGNMVRSGFRRWLMVVHELRRSDRVQEYQRLTGTVRLKNIIAVRSTAAQLRVFDKWWAEVMAQRVAERERLEGDSARRIQNCYRGYIARGRATVIRNRLNEAKRSAAATKIQSLYRTRAARAKMRNLKQHLAEQAAATKIQSRYRGRVGIMTARKKTVAKEEGRAAVLMQSQWRKKTARRDVAGKRQEKKEKDAAVAIQSRMRSRGARAEVQKRREQKRIRDAAVKIQACYRGMRGREAAYAQQRRVADKIRAKNRAATKIQAQVRRRRCQLRFELKMEAWHEEQDEKRKAATRIQCVFRGNKDRHLVASRQGDAQEAMVALAKKYREMWDEDNQQHFYFDDLTQEALWEPPGSGYVKKDGGQLVLQNGDVIDDPAWGGAKRKGNKSDGAGGGGGGGSDDDDEEIVCVECERVEATRSCEECDDRYCDACYDRTHSTGKRVSHTWTPLGTQRCMECEEERASKWCIQCDDPYCDDCFASIHRKGKKSQHQWRPPGQAPDDLSQAYAAGAVVGGADPATDPMAIAGAWQEFYDDANGIPYWFNTITQESSYEPPPGFSATARQGNDGYGTDGYGAEMGGMAGGGGAADLEGYGSAYEGMDGGGGGLLADGYSTAEDGGGGGGGNGDWTQYHDDESGVPYWYNAITGDSTYEDPSANGGGAVVDPSGYGSDAAFAEGYGSEAAGGEDNFGGYSTTEDTHGGGGGEWTEYQDDESGCPYWYNATSGESTYDNPNGDRRGGGGNWQELYDDESGQAYWYDEQTGESSWTDPT